jgi:hypothetical protein
MGFRGRSILSVTTIALISAFSRNAARAETAPPSAISWL